ncbi:MAG: hypothetical protein AAFV72_00300 [Cyanobacteria bacterium J06635_1]
MPPELATDGLTVTENWVAGQDYTTLTNALRASSKIIVDLSPTSEGVIQDVGGNGFGAVLSAYQGTLYFRGGDGTGDPVTGVAQTGYATWPIVGSQRRTIEWSMESDQNNEPGKVALYVDGELIEYREFTAAAGIAGGNRSGIGVVRGSAPNNPGNWTIDGQGVYSDNIYSCEIFLNQLTTDLVHSYVVPGWTTIWEIEQAQDNSGAIEIVNSVSGPDIASKVGQPPDLVTQSNKPALRFNATNGAAMEAIGGFSDDADITYLIAYQILVNDFSYILSGTDVSEMGMFIHQSLFGGRIVYDAGALTLEIFKHSDAGIVATDPTIMAIHQALDGGTSYFWANGGAPKAALVLSEGGSNNPGGTLIGERPSGAGTDGDFVILGAIYINSGPLDLVAINTAGAALAADLGSAGFTWTEATLS